MTREEFERLLDVVVTELTAEARNKVFETSKDFENRVRQLFEEHGNVLGIVVDYDPHPYAFPDIAFGEFGAEVKFTTGDSWRSVANSVLESHRNAEVKHIYVVYGKMGGEPEVRWGYYADCVIHVRTSHVPRFELQIGAQASLFAKMDIPYGEFAALPIEQKMHYIREYARGRLKEGEHLWWLEERPEQEHSVDIVARLYTSLPDAEQRKLRAEAALLFPQCTGSSRARKGYNGNTKYADIALFLLTYHGVLCHQTRDLFTAGSAAEKNPKFVRGTDYLPQALEDIEAEMYAAAETMDDALFVEYWGESVPPEQRIARWLERADRHATEWVPSEVLFQGTTANEIAELQDILLGTDDTPEAEE